MFESIAMRGPLLDRRRPRKKKPRKGSRSWTRRLTILAAVALLGPPLMILPLRIINPPSTSLMVSRAIARGAYPRRQLVPLEKISPDLIRAVLAAEDDSFYLHHGFDVGQIKKALAARSGGRKLRGASTISQQTVKNLYLWSGRSIVRKGLEAYLTFYLEALLPKDRILEIYLNIAECADGIFGVEMASQHWFKKPASAMTAEEGARLASVLPNPRKWSPFGDYAAARANQILEVMSIPLRRP